MKRVRRFLLNYLILALLILFIPYLFSRVASSGRQVKVAESPTVNNPSSTTTTLTVAAYNIAHGRGLVHKNWNGEDKATRLKRLDQLAEVIKQTNADIVVLNEVDFKATWSHRINQAEYLAEKAGYRWWAEERNMDFQVGWLHWQFGNAVLSKYPIESAQVIDLPALKEWENILVGKKRGLLTDIDIRGKTINVAAVHLSHRSEDLRVDSARQLIKLAEASSQPLIIAGDLNSTPSNFPRSNQSAAGENAIDILNAATLFHDHIGDQLDTKLMTFPADNPNSKIDWILIPNSLVIEDYQVISSTLSDHLPVVTRFKMQ